MNLEICAFILMGMLFSSAKATPDRDTLFDSIRLDKEDTLTPEKTLELLEEYNLVDPDDEVMSSLLNLSKNHEEKCGFDEVQEIRYQIMQNLKDSESIKAYKRDQWQKLVAACKEVWKGVLIRDVASLLEEDRQRIKALKESILCNVDRPETNDNKTKGNCPSRYNYKRRFYDVGSRFPESIIPYFEQNIDHSVMKALAENNHKVLFNQDYQKLIGQLCSNVHNKMKKSRILYAIFEWEMDKSYVDDDEFVRDWLENLQVCKTITRKRDLSEELYLALKQKHVGFAEKIIKFFSGNRTAKDRK